MVGVNFLWENPPASHHETIPPFSFIAVPNNHQQRKHIQGPCLNRPNPMTMPTISR